MARGGENLCINCRLRRIPLNLILRIGARICFLGSKFTVMTCEPSFLLRTTTNHPQDDDG